jgi:hypothetical protein
MSSHGRSDLKGDLKQHNLFCPFVDNCIMPKSSVICKLPNYRECSEYRQKLRTIKKARNLH